MLGCERRLVNCEQPSKRTDIQIDVVVLRNSFRKQQGRNRRDRVPGGRLHMIGKKRMITERVEMGSVNPGGMIFKQQTPVQLIKDEPDHARAGAESRGQTGSTARRPMA